MSPMILSKENVLEYLKAGEMFYIDSIRQFVMTAIFRLIFWEVFRLVFGAIFRQVFRAVLSVDNDNTSYPNLFYWLARRMSNMFQWVVVNISELFDRNFAHFLHIGYTTTVHLTELISYRDEAALYMTKNLDMSYAMDMIKKPVFQVISFPVSLSSSFLFHVSCFSLFVSVACFS